MKTNRRGIKIECTTFRVLPDGILDLWRERKLHDSAVKVWLCMQRLAYENKGEIGFNQIQKYCGIGRTTLSRAIKQLIELGLIRRHGQVYMVLFEQPIGQSHGETSQSHHGTGQSHGGTSQSHGGTGRSHDGTGQSHGGTSQSHGGTGFEFKTRHENHEEKYIYRENHGEFLEKPSSITVSDEDLAVLSHRYGIRDLGSLLVSPAARVALRLLIEGDEHRKEFARMLLRYLSDASSGRFNDHFAAIESGGDR